MVFRYTVASFLVGASLCSGHDIWLLPDAFVLARGETLVVRQMLGEELARGKEELALMRRITSRFALITPAGTVNLLAELPPMRERPEIKPVLERTADFDGPVLVVMDHEFIHHEMAEETFLEYLHHEGFDESVYRPHMGKGNVERERYARAFKSLVQVGDGRGGGLHRRIVGQKLEMVLLKDPYELRPGDPLDVRVFFDSEPLPDARVAAYATSPGAEVVTSSARTDPEGTARFTLDRAGTWLLRLVHLIPCSELDDGCRDVEWESYWASFSFGVRKAP